MLVIAYEGYHVEVRVPSLSTVPLTSWSVIAVTVASSRRKRSEFRYRPRLCYSNVCLGQIEISRTRGISLHIPFEISHLCLGTRRLPTIHLPGPAGNFYCQYCLPLMDGIDTKTEFGPGDAQHICPGYVHGRASPRRRSIPPSIWIVFCGGIKTRNG